MLVIFLHSSKLLRVAESSGAVADSVIARTILTLFLQNAVV